MKAIFWGTRGSLPTPLRGSAVRAKLVNALVKGASHGLDTPPKAEAFIDRELGFAERSTFGGNSACVEIEGGEEYLLCDLGTGAREFALAAVARHGRNNPKTFNVLMSHLHWDHIMGFPFFSPAHIKGSRIRIHGCHAELEQAFRRQNAAPNFPVDFTALKAAVEFVTLEPGRRSDVAGFAVTAHKQLHSGDSYGYRIEKDGKALVYTTDAEHKLEDAAEIEGFAAFLRDADLVIFDAMYSLADAFSLKEDWGHASNVVGVELCQMAGVRHLCLFHHEPVFDDARLETIFKETLRFEEITRGDRPALRISTAYDGLVIEV
jgi:phosphoribosyl 1,2-cyclic phosphodiesterase